MTHRVFSAVLLSLLTACLFLLNLAFAQDRQIRRNPQSEPLILNSDRKVALVIGNGAYPDSPLKNPVNDAKAVAKGLRELGFETDERANIARDRMMEAIDEFGKKLRLGGVGLFYFSGHGVQVNGENYLIPVASGIEFEEHVRYRAVNVGEVLGAMENAKNPLNIVILDACRNNPFKRSFRSSSQGLAMINAPSGSLIAYSTAPGSLASDGDGKYGLYTQELIENMQVPGIKIEEMFKRIRKALQEKTHSKQVPWESSSLVGDFYFKPQMLEATEKAKLEATPSLPRERQSAAIVLSQPIDEKPSGTLAEEKPLPTFKKDTAPPHLSPPDPSPQQSAPANPVSDNSKQKDSLYASIPPSVASQTTSPHPQSTQSIEGSKLKVGIFPWLLTGEALHFTHMVLNIITGPVADKAHIEIAFNDYKGSPEKTWTRKNALSLSEPNKEFVLEKGRQLGIDAGLLFAINVRAQERDVRAYLVDVRKGVIYSLNDYQRWVGTEKSFDSVETALLKLFREYNSSESVAPQTTTHSQLPLEPFLGKWEGEWNVTSGAVGRGTRKCKLSVYIENGQGYVDYHLGIFVPDVWAKGHQPPIDQKKLTADVKYVDGNPFLVFTGRQGTEIRYALKEGKLIGRKSHGVSDDICTLVKTK